MVNHRYTFIATSFFGDRERTSIYARNPRVAKEIVKEKHPLWWDIRRIK